MKWLALSLLLMGCATKNISFETEIVKPPRPEPLSGVSAFEIDGNVCMSPADFGKTFKHITDINSYADQLELLLDSVTKEIE